MQLLLPLQSLYICMAEEMGGGHLEKLSKSTYKSRLVSLALDGVYGVLLGWALVSLAGLSSIPSPGFFRTTPVNQHKICWITPPADIFKMMTRIPIECCNTFPWKVAFGLPGDAMDRKS